MTILAVKISIICHLIEENAVLNRKIALQSPFVWLTFGILQIHFNAVSGPFAPLFEKMWNATSRSSFHSMNDQSLFPIAPPEKPKIRPLSLLTERVAWYRHQVSQ